MENKEKLMQQLIENLTQEDIISLFLKLTDKININSLIHNIRDNRIKKTIIFKFIAEFLKSYKIDFILNNGGTKWSIKFYREIIIQILRNRYKNTQLVFEEDDHKFIFYDALLLDFIDTFEFFTTSSRERTFYTISKSLNNYTSYIVENVEEMKEIMVSKKVKNLDYRIVLKNILKEDKEWLEIKQNISSLTDEVEFIFLGSGGVNSNFIYTYLGSNFYYNIISQTKYPDIEFGVFDEDRYDIVNLFRILPPVSLRKSKAEELIKAIRSEYFPYFYNNRFSKKDLPKCWWRQTNFRSDDTEIFEETKNLIYIGMVNSNERKSIYSSIYKTNKNLIEITFQDNKFYITLNPQIQSDSSLVQETYGQTDNVLFMFASVAVAKEVEKFILQILQNPHKTLPTKQVVIDATQKSTYDKVAHLYYLLYQQMLF